MDNQKEFYLHVSFCASPDNYGWCYFNMFIKGRNLTLKYLKEEARSEFAKRGGIDVHLQDIVILSISELSEDLYKTLTSSHHACIKTI